MSLGLRRAVELRQRVVAAAHHGQNIAGGVVDGHHRALRAGVLLQRGAVRRSLHLIGEVDINHIARLEEGIRKVLAGPGPVAGQQNHLFRSDSGIDLKRQHAGHDGVNVISGVVGKGPVGMLVVLNGDAIVQNVLYPAAPAMTAFVSGQAIGHGVVGGLLQVEIEGGVDPQAGLVHFFAAEALFEFAAHFLLEPRGHGHFRLHHVQAEGSLPGSCLPGHG